jgi:hypothetical protein
MLFLKYQSISENIKTQVDKVLGEDINNHIRWNFRLCVAMELGEKNVLKINILRLYGRNRGVGWFWMLHY